MLGLKPRALTPEPHFGPSPPAPAHGTLKIGPDPASSYIHPLTLWEVAAILKPISRAGKLRLRGGSVYGRIGQGWGRPGGRVLRRTFCPLPSRGPGSRPPPAPALTSQPLLGAVLRLQQPLHHLFVASQQPPLLRLRAVGAQQAHQPLAHFFHVSEGSHDYARTIPAQV